ncbi:MarR family winged helix-turn-helix transcriptional regulator [Actinomycetospora sp. TBRC 11914]|uniref:MarR family winged helix-turn-helix transcriptional regulator n=1 Tax=Actinomycetospora sp. TBRC 11914 TaxID=2729387 RepID=UPI00145F7396|nr:MarR family transcriptional regulator [Actinomycetospora sp. TBRC 11914]NMO89515.1 MarR family transcriptional regulator [Actinomycetospora sp. TBRC 11914]
MKSRPDGDAASRAVEALLAATPVLVGVASRALEALGAEVSLTQFRLLRVLAELGESPSAVVAERLGSAASSVTRLADRLEDSGHLVRRRERPNRSVVRLELTPAGHDLVTRVEEGRRRELTALVDRLAADVVPDVARALEALGDAAGAEYGHAGPIELQAL